MSSSTSNFKRWVIIWLATLASTFGLFVVASEVLIRTKVAPNDLFYRHLEFYRKSTARNAVFGDSHAALGFTGVPGWVNLGNPSENLEIIEAKVTEYLNRVKLRRVILPADPHLFSESRAAHDVKEILKDYFSPAWLYTKRAYHQPDLIGYWKVYLSKGSFKSVREFQPDGAQTLSYDMEKTHSSAAVRADVISRVRVQTPAIGFENSRGAAAMERMVKLAKERGVDVCLVTFPLAPIYLEEAKKQPQFGKAIEFYQRLAERSGVRYLDMRKVFQDYKLFANQDHLNLQGARIFGPKIVEACFGKRGSE